MKLNSISDYLLQHEKYVDMMKNNSFLKKALNNTVFKINDDFKSVFEIDLIFFLCELNFNFLFLKNNELLILILTEKKKIH